MVRSAPGSPKRAAQRRGAARAAARRRRGAAGGRATAWLGLLFAVPAAPAEHPRTRPAGPAPLVTDRPDFTESPYPVPPGRVQWELGYTFTFGRERRTRRSAHTAPELLARLGLHERLELHIGWEGYTWSTERFPRTTPGGREVLGRMHEAAAADVSVGLKLGLGDPDGLRPALGLLGELTLPSGSPAATAGDVEPAVLLACAWDIGPRLSVGANGGLAVRSDPAGRFVQTRASVSASLALDERTSVFVEYFGLYPDARGQDAAHAVDAGLTVQLTADVQFDVRAGVGLNRQAPDLFAGIGLAWRW